MSQKASNINIYVTCILELITRCRKGVKTNPKTVPMTSHTDSPQYILHTHAHTPIRYTEYIHFFESLYYLAFDGPVQ